MPYYGDILRRVNCQSLGGIYVKVASEKFVEKCYCGFWNIFDETFSTGKFTKQSCVSIYFLSGLVVLLVLYLGWRLIYKLKRKSKT